MTKVVPIVSTIKKVVKKAHQKAKVSSASSAVKKNKERHAAEKRKIHSLSVVKKAKNKAKKKHAPFYSVALEKRKHK